ncbi:hypothetical protein D3C79_553710 [compost metagenome]
MDDHGEGGRDDLAVAIADAVLEDLGQPVSIAAQGLHRAIAVVHHIAVVALGIEHQAAIVAGQGLARRAVDAIRADYAADGQGVAVRVVVRCTDAAARVQAGTCIVQSASLDRIDANRADHGRVVDPGYRDHQLRLVGKPATVLDLISEDHIQALPGGQCADGGVGAVDHEAVGAVIVEGELAEVAIDQAVVGQTCHRAGDGGGSAAGHRGERATCTFQPAAHTVDLELGGGWLVHIINVGIGTHATSAGDHVARGIDRRRAVVAGPCTGTAPIVHGHRGIVGALDGDHQHAYGTQATGIGHLVSELLDQCLAGGERLHGGVAVVDDIPIAAVGVDGQGAEGRRHAGGLAAGNRDDPTAARAVVAYCAELSGFAQRHGIHVSVVVQHIAGGVLAGRAVVGTAGLEGGGGIALCHGSVVGAMNIDLQHGAAGQAAAVDDVIIERFADEVARRAQRLHRRIVVVDDVLEAATGGNRQGAIQPLQGGDTVGRYCHATGCGAVGDTGYGEYVVVGLDIDVGIIAQHITGRVHARVGVVQATGFHGGGQVGVGDRCIVDRVDDDIHHVRVG